MVIWNKNPTRSMERPMNQGTDRRTKRRTKPQVEMRRLTSARLFLGRLYCLHWLLIYKLTVNLTAYKWLFSLQRYLIVNRTSSGTPRLCCNSSRSPVSSLEEETKEERPNLAIFIDWRKKRQNLWRQFNLSCEIVCPFARSHLHSFHYLRQTCNCTRKVRVS